MLRHAPDLAEAMRTLAWFFLDPAQSSLEVRVREVTIARTCALNECEYQWGNHQAVFGGAAGFTEEERYSTVHGTPEDPLWSDRDRAVLRAVDELVLTRRLSDKAWNELRQHLSEGQILEVVTVVGWYALNCYTTNVMEAPLEPFTLRFPAAA